MLESVVKVIIFLVLLALGGYFFVLFRKKSWFMAPKETATNDTLQIVSRLALGGRCCLAVVRCNGQKFLVGITSSSITAIGELQSIKDPQVDLQSISPNHFAGTGASTEASDLNLGVAEKG